ncbi:Cytochrome c peroxidase, mitochondrial [Exophiala mesophila]|uniref:Peroxidase n=1 Tax=Exophiala mesophila TaxID=212818 RepID=A0A438MUQ3_EXOME|nr:Cytochrome c peroxidase, mitochondrial [Exophiala mesophila]
MATAVTMRCLPRAVPRFLPSPASAGSSKFHVAASRSQANVTRRLLQRTSRRQYSSSSDPSSPKSNTRTILGAVTAAALVAGGALFYYSPSTFGLDSPSPAALLKQGSGGQSAGVFKPTAADYQKVYDAVAQLLWDHDEYEDGSYGPVVLRLAWHASGTYDAATGTGGSNGATMRFAPEAGHGANAGLQVARDFLEPVKKQFPWISYGDLWTLAGVTAVQEMQGPTIPWRPGRQDRDISYCTPDGRLPDATQGQNHIRAIFGRMGFNDQEMVALSGAHALGRCHTDRSGFDGPWTFSPTVLTNDYYRLLLEEKWGWRNWKGPKQYQDNTTKSIMMLPTDMALVQDKVFKHHVQRYAADEKVFFKEFSDAVQKLFELGVPFTVPETERITFTLHSDSSS